MGVVADVQVQMSLPVDISSLSLTAWWKADSIAGLNDGDPIATWTDSSGNGRNLTASGGDRPTYKTNVLNGRPAVYFDNHVLASSATLANIFGANGVGAIFAVFQTLPENELDTNANYIFNDSNDDATLFHDLSTGQLKATNDDGTPDVAAKAITAYDWHLGFRGKDASNVYAGVDDLADASLVSVASGATASLTGTISVGKAGPTLDFRGYMVELIVLNSYPSVTVRRQIAYYFHIKYGLNFPYGSPRSVAAPFVNVTADVLASDGIHFKYGMTGNSQVDRVAPAGTLQFSLVNSTANSAGLNGYYSPGHANQRLGFDFGTEVRVAITYGGTTYYKWRGTIDEIVPLPGKMRRITQVTCLDWMDEAARGKVSGVAVQIDKRADEVFLTLRNQIHRQPAGSVIDTDTDTFPVTLDDIQDESGAILTEFQRIAQSEMGYIFVKGNTTQGETLVFEGRRTRANLLTNLFDFGDSTIFELSSGRRRSDIVNLVKLVIRPRRIDTTATTVLGSIITTTNPFAIPRGVTAFPFIINYRDPAQPAIRAGGTEIVSPVGGTDYLFNSLKTGAGDDLTSQLSIATMVGGTSISVEVTNNGPRDGWLTLLQVRGKGVYSYEPVVIEAEDTQSKDLYGENILRYEMPYQGDLQVGLEAAHFLLERGRNPLNQVDGLGFVANDSDALMTQALVREISDRIGMAESTTGIDYDDEPKGFFINGVEFDIRDDIIRCSWVLVPTDFEQAWILEDTVYGILNRTTRLGFSIFS